MEEPYAVEEGVFKAQLILPESLEHRRSWFESVMIRAQRRIIRFAERHSWKNLTLKSFFDHAEIYDTKKGFDRALTMVSGIAGPVEFPITYSAALENRVLMAVSPELYAQNYPEGVERNSYEKLLAHEMAHRLHIRILGGNENAMGPTWFFEGFAIYAADQFAGISPRPNSTEIQSIITGAGRMSYRKYGDVFRCFAQKASVKEMVEHAAEEDFLTWLRNIKEE